MAGKKPERFIEKVTDLCDELEERIKKGEGVVDKNAPRILIAGTRCLHNPILQGSMIFYDLLKNMMMMVLYIIIYNSEYKKIAEAIKEKKVSVIQ